MPAVEYPNVPDAPGVPPVKRAAAVAIRAADDLQSASVALLDISGGVAAFAPELGGQIARAAAQISTGVQALNNAVTLAERLSSIRSIENIPDALNSAGALVAVFDPELARKIAAAARLIKSAIAAVKLLSKLFSKRKKEVRDTESKLASDSPAITALVAAEWGIYAAGGGRVLDPDNIVAFGYSSEYRTADYPIERGGFETYDKVALPFETRIVMSKGGTLAERQAFLDKVKAIKGDRNLYNVVTPEETYQDVNIVKVQFDRAADHGATMLTVEIYLREVRQSAEKSFVPSQSPSAAGTRDSGSVQPLNTDARPGSVA